MFNIFKKNKIMETKQNDNTNNDIIIPITWSLLTSEQKIKIANIVLKNENVSIMGCCGDIERAKLIECTEIDNSHGREDYKFLTSDSFYKTVYFSEQQIIDRWLHYNKYKNKDYSNLS
jgi:hypothetical protein